MDFDTARHILRTQHHAVMATTRKDGTPQMSPVVATVDDAGFVVVSTRATAYKVRNIRRDSRVSLCVLPDNFFGQWIRIDGTADVVPLPDALSGLEDYYRRISGEHPDWDEYRAMMHQEHRVLLRIDLVRVGPDHSG
jgi:PPOX class probable F420-dependent enzyme